jgi:hypothetical protein
VLLTVSTCTIDKRKIIFMDKSTKVILGVAGVAAVIGAVWYFSQPKQPALPTYQRAPVLSPGASTALTTASEINAGAQGANALANLVSSVADATSSDDTDDESTLSGLGGLYGRE